MKTILIASAVLLMTTGCATAPQHTASSDPRECARHFASEGSALSMTGTRYTTSAFVPGVTRRDAAERAAKQIAMDGLTITTLDKESGLIMASNHVIGGKGDAVPLVVNIESRTGGVNLEFKFSNRFGQVATDDTVRTGFCKIADAVGRH